MSLTVHFSLNHSSHFHIKFITIFTNRQFPSKSRFDHLDFKNACHNCYMLLCFMLLINNMTQIGEREIFRVTPKCTRRWCRNCRWRMSRHVQWSSITWPFKDFEFLHFFYFAGVWAQILLLQALILKKLVNTKLVGLWLRRFTNRETENVETYEAGDLIEGRLWLSLRRLKLLQTT